MEGIDLKTFMTGGVPKGVRYVASYVVSYDGKTVTGDMLGAVVDYQDAETFLAKKKMTPKSGTVPPHLHPDQLFWRSECDFGMDVSAKATCKAAASKGKLLRIEVDCNIMACGDRGHLSCCCAVPRLIVGLFPSTTRYEIHVFGHVVPSHYGKKGKLVLLGNSSMSNEEWLALYAKSTKSWDWES
ncbi:Hypothetical protein A7982_01685 [Minicystis rosea]|nr:Hypothetical protein A7982_01685 [Minicystis rosea]